MLAVLADVDGAHQIVLFLELEEVGRAGVEFVRRLDLMMLVGSLTCCFSGIFGVMLSYYLSVYGKVSVSSSAVIVLTMTMIFLLAYLFAPKRGVVWNFYQSVHVSATERQ